MSLCLFPLMTSHSSGSALAAARVAPPGCSTHHCFLPLISILKGEINAAAAVNTVNFCLGENDSRACHRHGCVMMRLFVHSLPHLTFNSTYLIAPVVIHPPLPQPQPTSYFSRMKGRLIEINSCVSSLMMARRLVRRLPPSRTQ